MGILHATIFYFLPILLSLTIGFKCLPKKVQRQLLNDLANIK